MRFTQKKLFINFAKKNASRNWAGKEPDQSHYFVYLPLLFDRVALSHSLPDYRHTNCMRSLIGRFHINEYSRALAAVTCVGYCRPTVVGYCRPTVVGSVVTAEKMV